MTVSLIIPTRNRAASLRRTLLSLALQASWPDEIIIVDQSTPPLLISHVVDCMPEYVRSCILRQPEASLTAARNRGMDAATGDVIAFMDDDVLLEGDAIGRLRGVFDAPNIAFAASGDRGMKNRPGLTTLLGLLSGRRKLFRRGSYVMERAMLGVLPYPRQGDELLPAAWGMGFFFACRRSVVTESGLRFDERLTRGGYAEDLDFTYAFCTYCKQSGRRSVYVQDMPVRHLQSGEARTSSREAVRMYVVHRWYLSYKYAKDQPLRRLALMCSDIPEIMRQCVIFGHPFVMISAHVQCVKNRKLLRSGEIPDFLIQEASSQVDEAGDGA